MSETQEAQGERRLGGSTLYLALPGVAFCLATVLWVPELAHFLHVPGSALCLATGIVLGTAGGRSLALPGAQIVVRHGLRIGVALLGLTLGASGWADMATPLVIAAIVVLVSLATGALVSRLVGARPETGFISGAGAGICGVSAALACADLLPRGHGAQRDLAVVVAWISLLSSMAMLGWGLLGPHLGWSAARLGTAIGASIHDVAQAAAAGYGIQHRVGDSAIAAKMARVVMLLPLLLGTAALLGRREGRSAIQRIPPYLPAFALLAGLGATHMLPQATGSIATDVSQYCLAAAITGIGVTTQWRDILRPDWRIPVLLVAESVAVTLVAIATSWFFVR